MKDNNANASQVPGEGYWRIRKEPEIYGYTNPLVYVKAIGRNLVSVALLTTLAAIGSWWYANSVTPIYKASSTLLVQPQPASIINVKNELERFGRERNLAQTQVQIIKSRELIARVITALENNGNFDSAGNLDMQLDNQVDAFLDNLSISNIPDTSLIRIDYAHRDPEIAAAAANTVAQEYIASDLEARRRQIRSSTEVLDRKQAELKEILKSSESNLLEFKRKYGLLDLDNKLSRLNEQSLSVAVQGLSQAKMEVARLENELTTLRRSKEKTGDLSTTSISQRDNVLSQLYGERTKLILERSEFNTRYGRRHPKVVDVNNRLQTLAAQIASYEKRMEIALEGEYNTALLSVSNFENSLREGKDNILGIGERIHELEALEREVNTNRETFLSFFRSLKESSSTQGLEASIGRITELAHRPSEPWKPQKVLIIALCTLITFALSSVIAVFRDITSDRVRDLRELERRLRLPILGFTTDNSIDGFASASEERATKIKRIYAESIRSIRSRLLVRDAPLDNRIVGITSTYPDEGKTTLALDLAKSVSEMKRTLLIDCDLRLPSIQERLDFVSVTPGLTDLIKGEIKASQCIKKAAIGNLDVLPSGPINSQAGELLLTRNFAYIIDQLSTHYEKIIIDCPPLTAVSDTAIIGRTVSSMMIAVKIDSETTYKAIGEAVNQLNQADIPILGLVGTQLNPDKLQHYSVQHNYSLNYDYMNPQVGTNDLSPDELLSLDNASKMPDIDLVPRR